VLARSAIHSEDQMLEPWITASGFTVLTRIRSGPPSSARHRARWSDAAFAEEGGPHGIRVNTVNPDAVIQGSSIWSSDWKAERASAYGVSEDELQTFYQGRTKLGVAVLPEDVAEAIAFFAGPRSAKSTGNIVNVDGGVTAAYPR